MKLHCGGFRSPSLFTDSVMLLFQARGEQSCERNDDDDDDDDDVFKLHETPHDVQAVGLHRCTEEDAAETLLLSQEDSVCVLFM